MMISSVISPRDPIGMMMVPGLIMSPVIKGAVAPVAVISTSLSVASSGLSAMITLPSIRWAMSSLKASAVERRWFHATRRLILYRLVMAITWVLAWVPAPNIPSEMDSPRLKYDRATAV